MVKCFGERLVVDPYRPPYNWRDPAWKMRLTGGHSALLIDGKGHQYVDGVEGTNSSQANASVIRWGERKGYFFWSSDATPAYALVLPDVRSVTRTVVTLTGTPAVVVIDKVMKIREASTIQARFYAYNSDDKGSITASANGFAVSRPSARLDGSAVSSAGIRYTTSVPDIPPDRARLHPFADVSTTEPAMEMCLVTVLLPSRANASPGAVRIARDGSVYTAHITAGSASASVRILDSGTVPEFEVEIR